MPALPRARVQLLVEAHHHAGDETPALAIALDAGRALVRAPEPLAGRQQERVNVDRDLEVGRRPTQLEHAAATPLERQVSRDPDHAHEEVSRQDAGENLLGDVVARLDLTHVAEGVARRLGRSAGIDVVQQHQAPRLVHRRRRLVRVGALGEREQARDPAQHHRHRAGRVAAGRRRARGASRRSRAPRRRGGTPARARSRRGCAAPRRRTGARSRASAPRAPRPTAASPPAAARSRWFAARGSTRPGAARAPTAPAPDGAVARVGRRWVPRRSPSREGPGTL